MRAETDEARHPATERPGDTFLAGDLAQQAQSVVAAALGRGGAHHAGLDHVHRAADSRRDEPSQKRRRKVCSQVVGHASLVDAYPLEDIVRGQLRGGHQHGARRIGPHPAEETRGALGAGHLNDTVDGMSVVAALFQGQRRIVLHAHVDHVGRVTCEAADETGRGGHTDQGKEAHGMVRRGEAGFEFLVDPESRGRVGQLSQE